MKFPVEMSVQGLKLLLSKFGVQVERWGTGEANTPDQFFKELTLGESFLRISHSGELERVLRIVKLIIEAPEKGTLLEDYQIMADGRRKDRQQTPGGKVGASELPEAAVVREMSEELHLELSKSDYDFRMDDPRMEEKPSKSYPTLRSLYEIYPARIKLASHVQILDGYNTLDGEDGRKRLFFKWSGKKQEA